MKYIWQRPEWPSLTFQKDEVGLAVEKVERARSELKSRLKGLTPESQTGFHLDSLATEITESARIENQKYSYTAVRSSAARRLGFLVKDDTAGPGRKAEALISVLLDAVQRGLPPLTEHRILEWHRTLMEHDRGVLDGQYRKDEMQVISGNLDKEVLHFEAPHPDAVPREMANFGRWLATDAQTEHPWVAGSLAHLWFVTIHPFDDGNGRIARAIGEHFYAKADQSALRLFSYSGQLNQSREEYYSMLEAAQKADVDVTSWVIWSLSMLDRSIQASIRNLDCEKVAADLWAAANSAGLNPRQRKMVPKLIDGLEGNLTTTVWAQTFGCSQDTAERDLNGLVKIGIMKRIPLGRGLCYLLSHRYSGLSSGQAEDQA